MTAHSQQARSQPEDFDRKFLLRAIELSRIPSPAVGDLPFGAVVVRGPDALGEAHNEIASRCDPTAHAEILALRAAGAHLKSPALPDAVLYCSSEPCPMCLAACYWAGVDRIVHAATVEDTAMFEFEDAAYYRELALPAPERRLRMQAVGGAACSESIDVLRLWAHAAGRSVSSHDKL